MKMRFLKMIFSDPMKYDYYETGDPSIVSVRDPLRREWQGCIVQQGDGRWSPQSNPDLVFDTRDEAADAENR
jgi:hypothetical protein